jgi:thiamine biosynthesis protein ThiI
MALLVLHYHEMWLKGGNRSFFLSKFRESIRVQLSGLGPIGVEHEDGRVLVTLSSDESLAEAVGRVKRIFGVAHYSVADETLRELAAVEEAAWKQLAGQPFRTFAVRARRSDKTLPFRSQDAERQIGRGLLERAAAAGRSIKVDLERPDHPHVVVRVQRPVGEDSQGCA